MDVSPPTGKGSEEALRSFDDMRVGRRAMAADIEERLNIIEKFDKRQRRFLPRTVEYKQLEAKISKFAGDDIDKRVS